MQPNEQAIKQLLEWTDPLGVLSVYLDIPVEHAAPTWPITVRNRLHELEESSHALLTHDQRTVVTARLRAIDQELDSLMTSERPGRGHALFVGISDGRRASFTVQTQLPTQVELRSMPRVLPLLAALDEGRACGVIVLQRDGLQLYEWRFGDTEVVESRAFAIDGGDWRRMRGPAHSDRPHGSQDDTHTDLFEQRLDANRERFLQAAAGMVGLAAAQRHWQRLALFGDPHLAKVLLTALPASNEDVELIVDDHVLGDTAQRLVQQHATSVLHAEQRRRELRLVSRATDQARAGGRAALGLPAVTDALNRGRAGHLLIDAAADYAGMRSADGLLFPAQARPSATGLVREPYLVEAMVRRALTTDAQVTPVEGEAASALATHEGVAALLRW